MELSEPLWSFLFALFIITLFCLLIGLSLWRYRTIGRAMTQQALKRSGTITGSFLLPILKFTYHNAPIVVTSVPGTKYRHAKTEVSITLPKPAPYDLKIITESITKRLGKALGEADILLGSDEFDREFLIQTQDETTARTILTFTIQHKLLEMRQEKPRIILEGTWLTIAVPRIVKTEEGYDRLFDLSFAVVDSILDL
jgi:hypothetical protein